MDLFDWVTLIGFAVAIFQLWQVGRVARATHESVVAHARKVGDYSVLLLVPELQSIERKLERAIGENRPEVVADALREWRTKASTARGYLPDEDGPVADVAKSLQTSIASATRVKGKLRLGVDLGELTRPVQANMDKVCAQVSELAADLIVRVEPEPLPRTLLQLVSSLRSLVWSGAKG